MTRRSLTALLVGVLLATMLPATVANALSGEIQLVPPDGQTAVNGNDIVGIDGSTDEPGASIDATTLEALDASGSVIEAYSLNNVASNDDGTITGGFSFSCSVIPGCPGEPGEEADPELRASIDAYRLSLDLSEGGDSTRITSTPIEFDEVKPSIAGYFLIEPDLIEVRFTEDVTDPEGDNAQDWEVDDQELVTEVTGEGDTRFLRTLTPFGEDATPLVAYVPQPGTTVLPNKPYRDEAHNSLRDNDARIRNAADRIPPAPPTIDAIDGTATTRDAEDQAVPVLGSDPTPMVTVGSMTDGHTAQLYLDDGDGTLEEDRDTFVGDATASGGSAEVAWPDGLALPDGEHRLFARALDGADCDPDEPGAGSCPNASGRSRDALYDLDTTAPTLNDPALASTSAVTVVLSEPVTGPDTAGDWTITNADGSDGPTVTGVSGSGDTRVLDADGVLPDSTLRYAPAGDPYADDHGNQLAATTVDVVAQDFPVVRLVDAAPVEEQDGPPTVPTIPPYSEAESTFRVELSDTPRVGETVTVTLDVVEGTATAGADYTDPGEVTVELSGAQTGQDVTVELLGDTLHELDETFQLQVTDVTNAELADGTATATIADDDPAPELAVADASTDEGADASVTATIDAPTGRDVTAEWSLVAGTATAGDDFEVVSGSLVIPGDGTTTSTTVELPTVADELDEADETFQLVLGEVVNANVADDTAVVTITDDDPPPALRIGDRTVFEGDAPRIEQVSVTLSEVSGRDVEVDFATADGSATAGEDYTATSGTLTIPAGASGATLDVELLGDTTPEGDEAFTVTLSSPDNATITDDTATVELLEDDGGLPPVTLDVSGGSVDEGAAGLFDDLFPAQVTWTLTLSEELDGPVQVTYRTTDEGTAQSGEDFESTSGTVEIPAGSTSVEVSADVIDDDLYEGDETVALQVDDPVRVDLANGEATMTSLATISDDDPMPRVAFADGSEAVVVTEGEDAEFTVELDAVSAVDMTVDWVTDFDGEATTDDLPEQSGTVEIGAGDTTGTFQVTTTDDGAAEDDETVTIRLADPTEATLAEDRPTTSQLTLADDEVVIPTISVDGDSVCEDADDVCEGDSLPELLPPQLTYTFALDRATSVDVTAEYRTATDGEATPESDFTGTAGRVTIPAGETTAEVTVDVLDDELDEFTEDVPLLVTAPTNARLEGGVDELAASGRIRDDDPVVTVSIAGPEEDVEEGDAARFEVTLSARSGKTVRVSHATRDDGATEGQDYTGQEGELTFRPGEPLSQTVTVQTIDDFESGEAPEDVAVDLALQTEDAATIGDGTATATITDNDAEVDPSDPPVVGLSGVTVDEGSTPLTPLLLDDEATTEMTFEVRLSKAPGTDTVEVDWETVADTATAGEDFVAAAGTVTFTGDEQSQQVTIDVFPDQVDEADVEQLQLALTGATNATLAAGLARDGRIADDDPLPVVGFGDDSLDVGVDEGGSVELTVEKAGATDRAVTVDYAVSFDRGDGGAAADGDDLTGVRTGTVTIPADATSDTFTITTAQDGTDEPSESFSVVLSDPEHATLDDGADVATVTINDDDAVLPTLSVDRPEVDEGEAGTLGAFAPAMVAFMTPDDAAATPLEESLVFTVRLDEPTENEVTVDWTTTDTGTATAGSDYVADAGSVTIPAFEQEATFSIDVLDDDLDEFAELVHVRLSNLQNAKFSNGASTMDAAGRITDDDPLVTVDLGEDQEVTEGEPATFEVTLSAPSGKDVQLRHRTADGSAVAGEDYRATDDTLTIPAGDTSRTFTVPTLDDSEVEPTEDATVTLSVVAEDTAVLGRSTGTMEITDDDTGVDPNDTVVSLTGAAVEEGDPATPLPLPLGGNELAFEVRLSGPADGDVVIDYTTRAGTASAEDDFTPVEGQVTIADGQDRATVAVEVTGDFLDEFDEDLQLVLTDVSGDAVLPDGELARTGRILDDDPQAQLRVSDATVLEGDVAEFDVTLDNPSGKDIAVGYRLVDGTATVGDDVQPASGTLTFPAGTTARTVQVATLADGDTGEGIEQFEFVLSGATNAGIDDGRGTGSIIDIGVDGLPTATGVFLEDTTTEEADADRTALVPVRLSGERDQDTTVTWSSQQLTATAGEDYRAEGGQVVIPAGATSAQIPVTIIGDDQPEPNEDFLLVLTEAEGAVITGPTGRVTITDDDTADDGQGDGPGGGGDGGDLAGAPDGGSSGGGAGSGGAGAGDLAATGGGAGFVVFGLGLLAARRRRDGD